jgi:hypothetical protein
MVLGIQNWIQGKKSFGNFTSQNLIHQTKHQTMSNDRPRQRFLDQVEPSHASHIMHHASHIIHPSIQGLDTIGVITAT